MEEMLRSSWLPRFKTTFWHAQRSRYVIVGRHVTHPVGHMTCSVTFLICTVTSRYLGVEDLEEEDDDEDFDSIGPPVCHVPVDHVRLRANRVTSRMCYRSRHASTRSRHVPVDHLCACEPWSQTLCLLQVT
eukprot:2716881-Rhodomonas_salina.1